VLGWLWVEGHRRLDWIDFHVPCRWQFLDKQICENGPVASALCSSLSGPSKKGSLLAGVRVVLPSARHRPGELSISRPTCCPPRTP
jgi:hypothetical protein